MSLLFHYIAQDEKLRNDPFFVELHYPVELFFPDEKDLIFYLKGSAKGNARWGNGT